MVPRPMGSCFHCGLNEEAENESEVASGWNGGIASTCRPRDEGVEH